MSTPAPPAAPAVEYKVKWATLAAFLATSALLGLLEAIGADPDLIAPLPDWLEVPLLALIPTLVTFVAGYVAGHTPRPDLPTSKR